MKKKISIVGTVGIPACYGGFESLVENLTLNTSDDISYTIYCSSKNYKKKLSNYNNAELIYIPLKANGIQSIPYDILSLVKCSLKKPDVVMILGVSGCIFLPIFRLLSRSYIVTNIDGLEWKRDKWGKWTKRFLKLSEALAIRFSDAIITDNQAITNYVKDEYSIDSHTIAYGGDHAIRDVDVFSKDSYALGICRIEPENNVLMILEAFSKTEEKIKFIGNWQASEFGRSMKNKYKEFSNIELLEPIYDLDELYKMRANCSVYVHGHSAGGTNPSLVEMMHFGVPILAFDCSFNRYSTEDKAHYFESSNSLIKLLENNEKTSFIENSLEMKDIATRRYTWEKITELYEGVYSQ
ncbi:Alpha-D-GlcNAc alpha-1,2-L-rhamnosyltransferase [Vibrio chagasii]|nr:Alpha-D-GlcNAc alpha-1,2-L-rhamnosyltransferase [Vibrio chagasii]CAH6867917.1 Alpha-D-GlcNAc alpha-1,2-L-rhamnosyltransferase [Vibrio chagasii]CAH7052350.1 Alpha-D-GlcNAc alpha-1,2-L-rhamnosyltransferase [Vibrio chagasii]CAH7113387.1 Alpha-D-GlcNAc alpha-1,2-L-rhamnosyltransferase [Vibrio chagasii]CAH7303671.1 Alpha-D-GlcNAc alpha-1,2-L-rhamnosyltransferase [Vibrio chagasii]